MPARRFHNGVKNPWRTLAAIGISAVIAAVLFAAATRNTAHAGNACTWTGASSGAWNLAGNWTSCGGVIPASADDLTFPATGVTNCPTTDVGRTANSLTVASGFTCTGASANTIKRAGNLTVGAAAATGTVLSVNGGTLDLTGVTTTINGDVSVTGTGSYKASTSTVNGTAGGATGQINATGGSIDFSSGAQTIAGAVTLNGAALTKSNTNTLTINGALNMGTGTSSLTNSVAGSIVIAGAAAVQSGSTITNAGSGTITFNGTVTQSGATSLITNGNTGTGTINFNALYSLSSGTLNQSSTAAKLVLSAGWTYTSGTVTIPSGTITFAGASDSTVSLASAVTANNVTFAPTVNGKIVTIQGTSGQLTAAGLITFTEGLVKKGATTGTLIANGNVNMACNFDGGDIPMTVSGSGAQSLIGPGSCSSDDTLPPLTITKTGSAATTISGQLRTTNPVTLNALGDANGGSFTGGGILILSGTNTFTNNLGVTLPIANVSIGDTQGAFGTSTANITIGGSLAKLDVSGTLTLSNGQLNSGTSADSGSLTQVSTFTGGTTPVTLTGTGTVIGGGSVSTGDLLDVNINTAGTITLSGIIRTSKLWQWTAGAISQGSSTLAVAGATIKGSQTLNNVDVQSAGATLSNAAASDLTVGNTLTLNGKLTTNANTAIIGSAGSVTRNSGFIQGNERKLFPTGSGQSFTYDVGGLTNYRPVALANLNVTNSGTGLDATVTTTNGTQPQFASSGLDNSKYIQRYWTFTPQGGFVASTYDATFTFIAGDIVGGADTNAVAVGKYDGVWTSPTVGTRTSTSTQITGVTSGFSDYVIAEALATDGSGTATVSPTAQTAGTTSTEVFTYTAPGTITNGALTVQVPASWTAPQTSSSSAAGYVEANVNGGGYSTTNVAVTGSGPWTVTLSNLTLSNGQTALVRYGNGAGAATAPLRAETSSFQVQQKATSGGTLTTVSTPTVTVNASADGTGSAGVAPGTATAGATTTQLFTYTATTGGLTGGAVTVAVPATWTAPQTADAAAAGYVSASIAGGSFSTTGVAVTGTGPWTVTVSGVDLNSGQTVQIKYGDATNPAGAATAQPRSGTASFQLQEKSTSGGSLSNVGAAQTVTVSASADGAGSAGVAPGTATAGAATTQLFTYTATTGGLTGGAVTVAVPATWTAPQTGNAAAAGYVTASVNGGGFSTTGVAVTGTGPWTVTVSGVDLNSGQTVQIKYGDATNPAGAATAQPRSGTASFQLQEKSTSGGSLSNVGAAQTVTVSASADGAGSAIVSPTSTTISSTNNTELFTYTATSGGLTGGAVTVQVPASWTTPQTGSSSAAGYTTASIAGGGFSTTGVAVTGTGPWTVTVSGVDLNSGQTVRIKYGDATNPAGAATAPSLPETSSFPVQEKSTSGGTLTTVSTPTVGVTASDGAGTLVLDRSNFSASSPTGDVTFTYTAGAAMTNGAVTVALPSGWTAPQTGSSGAAGYITSSTGTPSASSQTITVSGVTLANGGTFTITYKTPTVGATTGSVTFTTNQKATTGGTLTALSVQPTATVYAPDGSGTAVVAPTSATAASTANTHVFTYTATTGGLSGGAVTVQVPASWSAPQTSSSSSAGYVQANVNGGGYSTTNVAVTGTGPWTITVSAVTIASGQTVLVRYGDVSANAGGAAVAPARAETSSFPTREKSVATGTLTTVSTPTVTVNASADGTGSAGVSPGTAIAGAATTQLFTYTATTGGLTGGAVSVQVPATWTQPQTASSSAAGYVTASINNTTFTTLNVAVTGSGPWTVTVSGVDVDSGQTVRINYGDTTNPGGAAITQARAGTASFQVQTKSTSGGTLSNVGAAQSVVVSASADGTGSAGVAPSTATAGAATTELFTYTATTGGLTGGAVTVAIPATWTTPQTGNAAAAGYVTASINGGGFSTTGVAVTGSGPWTVTVSGVDVDSGQTVRIKYGDATNPAGAALAQPRTGTASFQLQEKSTSGGTLANVGSAQTVTVSASADGTGSAIVSPTSTPTASNTTLLFTYTAAAGGLTGGAVTVEVPASWTVPQTGSNSVAGYTTASINGGSFDSANVSSITGSGPWTITVTGLDLNSGQTVQIKYGDVTNPAGAAAAPGSTETSSFPVQEKSTSGGTLTTVSTPTVTVSSAPIMQSATVNGTTLDITWSQALDPAQAVPGSAFSVDYTSAGSQTVIGTGTVTYSSTHTQITLASALHFADVVTQVTYTAPGSDPRIHANAGGISVTGTLGSATNNTVNNGPSTPGSLSPADNFLTNNAPSPTLQGTYLDADPNDVATATFDVCDNNTCSNTPIVTHSNTNVASGATTSWQISPALAEGTYYWRLTTTDSGNASTSSVIRSFVVDTTAPTVTSVTSSTANGSYNAGQVVSIQVNFSEPVTTSNAQLQLETGTTDRTVNYSSGSGTSTLTFNYTIQSGDTSSDLDAHDPAALTGTIRDAALNNADATLAVGSGNAGSLANAKALVIDTTPPTVTAISATNANGTYGRGSTIHVTVAFSEPVTITGTPQLQLETGATDEQASYVSGSGTSTLTFDYAPQPGDASSDLDGQGAGALTLNGGSIVDAATNAATLTVATGSGTSGALANAKDIAIDTALPTLSSITVAGSGNSVALAYDKPLANAPSGSSYTIKVNNVAQAAPSISGISGSTLTLTPATQIAENATVTVTYSAGSLSDATTPGNLAASFTDQATTNNSNSIAIAVSTRTVNGTALDITINEPLQAATPLTSEFTVSMNGGLDVNPQSVSAISNGETVVQLTLATGVTTGDSITVSYSGSSIVDRHGFDTLATFTAAAVTNNSGNQSPTVPALVSPAAGATVATFTPTLTGTFSDPDTGDTGHVEYQVCTDNACVSPIGATFSSATPVANGVNDPAAVPAGRITADGTYYWRARNKDGTAATSGFSAIRSIIVLTATTPPTPTLTAAPSDPTVAASAHFTFTSSGATTFHCQLDTGSSTLCTSPQDFSSLADGNHTFRVNATNGAGTSSDNVFGWTIDTTAPVINTFPPSSTNSSTATFTFSRTLGANEHFECRIDAGSWATCSSPMNYNAVSTGSHQFDVSVVDQGGTRGTVVSKSWTVGGAAPLASPTITGKPEDPSSSPTAGFVYNASGADHFECQLDGSGFATCPSPKTYSGLSTGSHTFTVRGVDSSNSAGTSTSYTWTVTPYLISSSPDDGATVSSAPANIVLTANKAVTWSGMTLEHGRDGAVAIPAFTGQGTNEITIPFTATATGEYSVVGSINDGTNPTGKLLRHFTVWAPPAAPTDGSTPPPVDPPPSAKSAPSGSAGSLTSSDQKTTIIWKATTISAATSSEGVVMHTDPQPVAVASTIFGLDLISRVEITATIIDNGADTGTAVHTLDGVLEIVMKDSTHNATPGVSTDGTSWTQISELSGTTLPSGQQDGFYRESNGDVHILTRHLTIFAIAKGKVALGPPRSLIGTVQNASTMVLYWEPPTGSPTTAHYYVYKDGLMIATLGGSTYQYIVQDPVIGDTSVYQVSADNSSGSTSPLSMKVTGVPDLSGLSTEAATALLTARGFQVGTTTTVVSNEATGTVVGQDPWPLPAYLPFNSNINLVIAEHGTPAGSSLNMRVATARRGALATRPYFTARIDTTLAGQASIALTRYRSIGKSYATWTRPVTAGTNYLKLPLSKSLKLSLPDIYRLTIRVRANKESKLYSVRVYLYSKTAAQALPKRTTDLLVVTGPAVNDQVTQLLSGSYSIKTADAEGVFTAVPKPNETVGAVIVDATDGTGSIETIRSLHFVFPDLRIIAVVASPAASQQAMKVGAALTVVNAPTPDATGAEITRVLRQALGK